MEQNPDFWDCECKSLYIHPKKIPSCPRCGAICEEQPDSIDSEIPVCLKAMNLRMKIKLLSQGARMPTRSYDGDVGWDLYASERSVIHIGETRLIQTDICLEIPDGWCGIIKDRSGLASQGLMVTGGVIDSSYRGPVLVVMTNVTRGEPFECDPGDRVAQLLFFRVPLVEWVVAESLTETERFDRGWGSTGR